MRCDISFIMSQKLRVNRWSRGVDRSKSGSACRNGDFRLPLSIVRFFVIGSGSRRSCIGSLCAKMSCVS